MLNEISLWTGTEISSDNYKEMGSYQMLGELLVDVQHGVGGLAADIDDYLRALHIGTAVHSVSYKTGGITYRARSVRVAPRRGNGPAVFRRPSGLMHRGRDAEGWRTAKRRRRSRTRLPLPASWTTA